TVTLSDFATLKPEYRRRRKGGYCLNGKYSPGYSHYTVLFVPCPAIKEKLRVPANYEIEEEISENDF
nr:hypothetical protein [Treponema sp.]